MKPKLWQGASPTGESFTRARHTLDMPANTSYGTELREDGTQGRVMSKSCGAHDAVYRENDPTGEPFLCTWQGTEIFFPDKTLPPKKQKFSLEGTGYTEFVGNSVFVGDGFMVGLVATSTVLGQPSVVAPLLMRLPRPGTLLTVEQFERADPSEKRKASILLPGISVEHLTTIYVVPMGWKNKAERYTFAIVTTVLADPSAVIPIAAPKVWTGSTGAFVAVKDAEGNATFGSFGPLSTPAPGLGVDWSWTAPARPPAQWNARTQYNDFHWAHPFLVDAWRVQTVYHSRVTCTGPGRLEFVVIKPEADNFTFRYAKGPSVPYRVLPMSVPTALLPWPTGNTGWAAGPGETTLTFDPGFPGAGSGPTYEPPYGPFAIATGFTVNVPLDLKMNEYAPRAPISHIVQSTDFGATWNMRHATELESTTLEYAPHGAGEITGYPEGLFLIDGSPDEARDWIESYVPYGHTVISAYSDNFLMGDFLYPWTATIRSRALQRPPESIGWPTIDEVTNRGVTARDSFETATLICAGSATFLITPGLEQAPSVTLSGLRTDIVDHLMQVPDPTHLIPYSITSTVVRSVMRVYRRSGGGEFERISWPLDSVSWPPGNTSDPVERLLPTDALLAQQRIAQGIAPTPPMSWACTGEGRMAIFFARIDGTTDTRLRTQAVLMVATTDNGATWTTLELLNADFFDQTVVIANDGRGSSILYAEPAAEGKLQLMRISADFTRVSKYGAPYSPGRGGLVNFQRYVHPGLPGLFDEPKETT